MTDLEKEIADLILAQIKGAVVSPEKRGYSLIEQYGLFMQAAERRQKIKILGELPAT